MKKYNKIFVYLMIMIMALTTLMGGVFAAGGGSTAKDKVPELKITKIRPKESTEYEWILEPSFGEWSPEDESGLRESMLEFKFERVLEVDNFSAYIEAELSTYAADSLVVELGYIGWVDEAGDPILDNGIPVTEPEPIPEGGDKETFIALYTEKNIGYQRITDGGEAIKLNFLWENIDRSLFDDPETIVDEDGYGIVEGITHLRLGVEYVKSRGNVGMETDQREIGLEEHEAYAFASIESDLIYVLDEAKASSDVTDPLCEAGADQWLINPFNLPLGEGDEFLIQAVVETNIPEELQFDEVTFSVYPYLESSDEYKVERDVEGYPKIVTAEFPSAGYVQSSGTSLASVTIAYDEEFWNPGELVEQETFTGDDELEGLFDEANLPYLLPIGSGIPTVLAVQLDPTADDPMVDQPTRDNPVATITVTAEDGTEAVYEIPFEFEGNTDARLGNLTINNTSFVSHAVKIQDDGTTPGIVDVEFNSSVYFYHIFTPDDPEDGEVSIYNAYLPREGIPADPVELDAIAAEPFYDESLIPADERVEILPKVTYGTIEYDGGTYVTQKRTIIVTSENQMHQSTYTILVAPLGFIPEEEEEDNGSGEGGGEGGEMPQPKTGKGLDVLAVDNVLVDGFVAGEVEEGEEEIELSVMLDEGTRSLPSVTAVASDPEATVQHIKPTRLPGKYQIKVNETDDSTTLYTLNMDVEGLEDGEFIELGAVLPQEILGLWLPPTDDRFVLGRTSTQIRFWTSEQLMSPQLRIYKDVSGEDTLFAAEQLVYTVTTSDLKKSGGNGKHSRTTVQNGDGGYYKYNLKGRDFPSLEEGEDYIIALFEFDDANYSIVHFQLGKPAMIHFTIGEMTKTTVDHRNRDINLLEQR